MRPRGADLIVLGVLLRLIRLAFPGHLREIGTAPRPFFCELEVDVLGRGGGGPHRQDVDVDSDAVVLDKVRLVRSEK